MDVRNRPNEQPGKDRTGTAIGGGYAGFGFGLLAIVATSSEVGTPSTGDAALILLVCMLIGFAAGWLLQPVLDAFFGPQQ